MGEKIEEMASGQPKMQSSGYSEANSSIKLDKKELDKLHMLRLDELQAIKEAEEAVKKRDKFCLEIEKRYLIQGKKWDVDFKTGTIMLIGEKP